MATTSISEASLPPSSLSVLKPHPSSHGQVIKLSAIDQIAPRDYMSICLFFRTPHANKERIFSILHEAVARTVNDIPELACCVQKHTNNDREEVELLFDAKKGVELYYKDYTSPELRKLWQCGTFDQLEREHFPLSKMPRNSVFGTCGKLEGDVRLPSLVLQANFIPGGLILGGCLHHVAGDGQCNFMLWSSIGSHFEAISDGLATKRCAPIQFLERSDVVEGDVTATLEEHPDWKLAHDTTKFLNPTTYDAEEDTTYEYATYFISGDKLSSLRKQLSALSPETRLGTVEALGAFLWRHVILARDIDPIRYPEAKLSITIDARGRMSGRAVPSTYWGNFAEPNAVARLPITRLQQDSSLSSTRTTQNIYPEAAQRIRRAISAVDDKAVRRLVGLLNQMPKSTTLTWNADRCPGPDMLIVCIQGHAYNDIHFGRELGYPSALRVTVGDTEGKPDGRCLILPPRRVDGKGLEIALQYHSSTLKKLEDNREFAEFFSRRN